MKKPNKISVFTAVALLPLLAAIVFPASSNAADSTPVAPATLNVVKHVVNTYGGTAVASDFIIHVTQYGSEVAGSPAVGANGAGHTYILAPGTYLVSETHVDGYYGTFGVTDPALGNMIDADGLITLVSGQNATVVRTNYQVAPAYVPVPDATAEPVPATPATTTPATTPVTQTGGKLPKTGSPWFNLLALAAGMVLLGGVGFGTKKVLN